MIKIVPGPSGPPISLKGFRVVCEQAPKTKLSGIAKIMRKIHVSK